MVKMMRRVAWMAVICLCVTQTTAAKLKWSGNVYVMPTVKTSTDENAAEDGSDIEKTEITSEVKAELWFTVSTQSESGLLLEAIIVPVYTNTNSVNLDDCYLKLGKGSTRFKIGRYEAEKLFELGEDLYIAEAGNFPGWANVSYARGRKNMGAGIVTNIGDYAAIDLNTVFGSSSSYNFLGGRPVVKFRSDTFTLKAGGEYYWETPKDDANKTEATEYSFGGNGEVRVGNFKLGASSGYRVIDGKDKTGQSLDDKKLLSFYGYVIAKIGETGTLGLGSGYSKLTYKEANDETTGLTGYLNYRIKPFVGIKGLGFEVGASYGQVEIENEQDVTNTLFGGRAKLKYSF